MDGVTPVPPPTPPHPHTCYFTALLPHSQASLLLDVRASELGLVQAEDTLSAVVNDYAVGTLSAPPPPLVLRHRSLDLTCWWTGRDEASGSYSRTTTHLHTYVRTFNSAEICSHNCTITHSILQSLTELY